MSVAEPRELSTGDQVAVGTVVLAFAGLLDSPEKAATEIVSDASLGAAAAAPAPEAPPVVHLPFSDDTPARPSGSRQGVGSRVERPAGPRPAPGAEARLGRPSGPKPALGAEPRPSGPKPALGAEVRPSGPRPALSPAAPPEAPDAAVTPMEPQPAAAAPVAVQYFGNPRPLSPPAPPPPSGPRPVLESYALLEAVIRTRLRREAAAASPWGRLRRFLQLGLSPRVRWRLAFGVALAMALGAAGLWFFPPASRSRSLEPDALGSQPLEDSFGLGEGVKWERPDFKAFFFAFDPPSRALVLLHYQANEISNDEVTITVNGAEVGKVPPDSHNVAERELEVVLPPAALKRGERNEVIFDNVKNPPGRERWMIWNLSVELVTLPELRPDELIAKAGEYGDQGAKLYRERQEDHENLFKAWKAYRFAWLNLEGLEDKPELYREIRDRKQAIGRELDDKCAALLLQAQGAIELKNLDEARDTLEEVSRYFPTGEHRCHNRALELLAQYGL